MAQAGKDMLEVLNKVTAQIKVALNAEPYFNTRPRCSLSFTEDWSSSVKLNTKKIVGMLLLLR